MGYRVAVAGATGAVGREMLQTLAERNFPADKVMALASSRSAGREVSYGEDDVLTIGSLDKFDFADADIALFSAGGDTAKEVAPKAGAAGCIVIDNSSAFRMDDDVPLIVPEVNADTVERALPANGGRNIIANPNCSTAQLVVALKPLHDKFGVRRVVVSTYQATSGAGKAAMDELFNQTRGIYVNDPVQPELFTKQIAFNAIPHIDKFLDDGFTKEEWKMTAETKKILDPAIELVAHCVRIPVFIGHSEAVFIETEKPMTEKAVRNLLRESDGITVIDHRADEGYVTPHEAAGEDAVFISRIRKDPTIENGMVFWCVSDNLRKGAALNSVQIAELVAERGLYGR
ncbi:MAG TPA: aspartate-semialdehyde dehydrogenase [Alphaproteobacteria bacterium]|jgi:aspartate-semialdehyde dehydrogenase|nr:aspartate-semialdehyde dehydrogenase [Rhodospirillaceae bacterium]PDH62695.1 MAG: aspartate-semialdehyde dehydrogenase [SAR116 cluster bacterium MED-G05]HBP60887.1 aspartate-semialdehyde dehydrogenase [Alphaproteobacteria bacterium]HBP72347.1 aspartate-semialdehyde dehydrogenase [Alphaproteobacteria bacterium]HCA13507.1 aspartate-semialdehyde dehydrogenase [Alphaproteobacteria bacterium]|tara:strand:+ start:5234 stop:6268 length:1035 start_codon:yes stop_codon:yes gene_type:complete